MKLLTFKISKSLLEEMDQTHKDHHFSNRTEFIRAAIREKIERCKTVHYISKNQHNHVAKKKGRMDYTG